MSERPEVAGSNFMPKNSRNRPFCIFFLPEPQKTNFYSSANPVLGFLKLYMYFETLKECLG